MPKPRGNKDLPAISGNQLIKLLVDHDGWEVARRANHGKSLRKKFPDGRFKVTVIPANNQSLPMGTLLAILGLKETGLKRKGLIRLLEKQRKST